MRENVETYIRIGRIKFRLETVFCLLFLIYTLLSFNSFTYGKRCISIFLYLTLLSGIMILSHNIFKKKMSAKKIPETILFSMFLLTNLIAIFWNGAGASFKDNIIKFIFQIFFFFILYDISCDVTKEYRRKEFNLILGLINIYMFIGAITSLALMWSGYSKMTKTPGGWAIGIGFVWGRLWGIYSEPNYITIVATIIILFNIYLLPKTHLKMLHVFCWLNMLVQFLFICFSDSRTGAVALGMTLGIYFFNSKIYKSILKKKLKRNLVTIMFMTMTIIVLGILLPRVTVKTYNIGMQRIQSHRMSQSKSAESSKEKQQLAPVVDRGYDTSADPSNRRFSIWKSGLEIFISTPFIGTSFSNILGYTESNNIDTYIVNNGDEKFSTIHNEVLNVLVSQGIGGLIILIILISVILLKIFPYFYRTFDPEEFRKRNFIFSSLICIICGSMFLTGMFYSNSPSTILFWYFLGYLVYLIQVTEGGKNDSQCLLDTFSNN